jgi:hypothetical protein
VRQLGLDALPWDRDTRSLQARMEFVRALKRNDTADWPSGDDAALLATLGDWLAPWLDGCTRRDHLARVQLADALLARFEDKRDGGFFFTSHDHEVLIQRNKVGPDNATPSGNGIAAQSLLRLSELTGETRYADAAERCLKLFFPALQQAAGYHCSLCTALAEHLQPSSLLVLRGSRKDTTAWLNALRTRYLPDVMTIMLDDDVAGLPEVLAKPVGEQTTAWLCHGTQCLPPITDLNELLEQLS